MSGFFERTCHLIFDYNYKQNSNAFAMSSKPNSITNKWEISTKTPSQFQTINNISSIPIFFSALKCGTEYLINLEKNLLSIKVLRNKTINLGRVRE